jgi:hypothetical protein
VGECAAERGGAHRFLLAAVPVDVAPTLPVETAGFDRCWPASKGAIASGGCE